MALSHVDRDGIGTAIERISKRIHIEPCTWEGEILQVTASFGAARIRDGIRDYQQLLREGLGALYCETAWTKPC
jgi:GGDEF domain-containing protein